MPFRLRALPAVSPGPSPQPARCRRSLAETRLPDVGGAIEGAAEDLGASWRTRSGRDSAGQRRRCPPSDRRQRENVVVGGRRGRRRRLGGHVGGRRQARHERRAVHAAGVQCQRQRDGDGPQSPGTASECRLRCCSPPCLLITDLAGLRGRLRQRQVERLVDADRGGLAQIGDNLFQRRSDSSRFHSSAYGHARR